MTKIAVSLDLWRKDLVDADIGQNYKKHQLVLLMFVIFLYVEWLFDPQRGPEKSNFWIILAQRPVMSSFGGRSYLPKCY